MIGFELFIALSIFSLFGFVIGTIFAFDLISNTRKKSMDIPSSPAQVPATRSTFKRGPLRKELATIKGLGVVILVIVIALFTMVAFAVVSYFHAQHLATPTSQQPLPAPAPVKLTVDVAIPSWASRRFRRGERHHRAGSALTPRLHLHAVAPGSQARGDVHVRIRARRPCCDSIRQSS